MDIFYFSGTGNSMQIARDLKIKLLNQSNECEIHLLPIISELNKISLESKNGEEIHISSPEVGLIFPVYAFTIPKVIEDFLNHANFKQVNYAFAIANRTCSSRLFSKINRILKRKGIQLNAEFSVETPQNYIPVFQAPTEAEIKEIHLKLDKKLDEIALKIHSRRDHGFKKDGMLLALISQTVFRLGTLIYHKTRFFHLGDKFHADSSCTGCGICEKICLANRIEMIDNKPHWNENIDCLNCLACVHYCPQHAIQIGQKTQEKGRYRHPNISFKDIAAQKTHEDLH